MVLPDTRTSRAWHASPLIVFSLLPTPNEQAAAAAVEAYLAMAPGTAPGDDRGGAGSKRKAATTPAASRKTTKGATGASGCGDGGGGGGGGGGSGRKPAANKVKGAVPTQPTTRHTKAEVPAASGGVRGGPAASRAGQPKVHYRGVEP